MDIFVRLFNVLNQVLLLFWYDFEEHPKVVGRIVVEQMELRFHFVRFAHDIGRGGHDFGLVHVGVIFFILCHDKLFRLIGAFFNILTCLRNLVDDEVLGVEGLFLDEGGWGQNLFVERHRVECIEAVFLDTLKLLVIFNVRIGLFEGII